LTDYNNQARIVVPNKYLNLAAAYFISKNWSPQIEILEGQVDRQVRLGNADLAVDIVYSGKTLAEEKLKIYQTIFEQSGLVLFTKDI